MGVPSYLDVESSDSFVLPFPSLGGERERGERERGEREPVRSAREMWVGGSPHRSCLPLLRGRARERGNAAESSLLEG